MYPSSSKPTFNCVSVLTIQRSTEDMNVFFVHDLPIGLANSLSSQKQKEKLEMQEQANNEADKQWVRALEIYLYYSTPLSL